VKLAPLHRILDAYPEATAAELAALIGERSADILEQMWLEQQEERFGKFRNIFPDMADCTAANAEGRRYKPVGDFKFYARDYYQKHMEFFRQGAT
jgi:hypothetical protein